MTDLITLPRAVVEQALHVATAAGYPVALIAALKAALEQPNRAQQQRDAGYTRRPTLREMADSEQPEQEPVALCDPAEYDDFQGAVSRNCAAANSPKRHAPVTMETVYETIIHWDEGGGKRSRRELARRIVDLYTHPPRREWRSLSKEEIHAALPHEPGDLDFVCARAIEAALKERNA
jgi:hypothetical protein